MKYKMYGTITRDAVDTTTAVKSKNCHITPTLLNFIHINWSTELEPIINIQLSKRCQNSLLKVAGSEINFFMLAPTGDWTNIFSRQMAISGRQNFFDLSSCTKRQNTCCASVFLAIFMLKNQLYSYQKTITTTNQKKVESFEVFFID